MELVVLGVGILGVGYLIILPLLTLIAWSRSSGQIREIEALRVALRALEKRAQALETRLAEQVLAFPGGQSTREAGATNRSIAESQVETKKVVPAIDGVLDLPVKPASAEGVVLEKLGGRPLDAVPASKTTAPPAPVPKPAPEQKPAIQRESAASPLKTEPTLPDLGVLPKEAAKDVVQDIPPAPAPLAKAAETPEPAPIKKIQPQPSAPPAPKPSKPQAAKPAEPGFIEKAIGAAKAWLFGGNTLVRVGMLLVFLGLSFLLRYASDYVVIPLELRYLGVALVGLIALALGWRLREKRPDFALLMQGGAVAVMYLTVIAALHLHDLPLLSVEAGFLLLVAVAALAAVLAVVQNAMSLALAASVGGFAAPVLVSTGGGNYVALFSYFALLNAGILGIAWFKTWRPLNLAGFFGTFLIGLAWGMRSYDPALHYLNMQGFLILFFLMFVGIGLLFARRTLIDDPGAPKSRDSAEWQQWLARQGQSLQRYVDGTLVFGTPLVGFGLQYALVQHIEYGAAFSALALGGFYLGLARWVYGSNPQRFRLLIEVFLALGVIFASLAIPLGLDAHWTSAAWAVEGAGLYWLGHRQRRPVARAFAVFLQAGALLAFLSELSPSPDESGLLAGSAMGALMLGLSLLCNRFVLLRHGGVKAVEDGDTAWDKAYTPWFSTLGLWSLYLIAPLELQAENVAIAWSLAGLLTVVLGFRLAARDWIGNGLVLQFFAGALFLFSMERGQDGSGLLALGASSLKGLFVATLVGLAALLSLGIALHDARTQNNPERVKRLAWMTLFGLGFIALAVLFVLPWEMAAAVWAASGFVLIWAAIRLELAPAFWFALFLEMLAGLGFINTMAGQLVEMAAIHADEAAAFAHRGFWVPVVMALAAFAVAWRLHGYARSRMAGKASDLNIDGNMLSVLALLWSSGWWVFAWVLELARIVPDVQALEHRLLLVMAATALIAAPIIHKCSWKALAALSALILPLSLCTALADYQYDRNLLAQWGWMAFGMALAGQFILLRRVRNLLPERFEQALHVVNCWVCLALASFELRYLFLELGEAGSVWRWLGWVLPLAAWLLWNARAASPRLWPLSQYPELYRFTATLPVVAILLGWLLAANLLSGGDAAPLPYIPLANPLELASLWVLFASWRWLSQAAGAKDLETRWQPFLQALMLAVMAGAFVTYTCAVLRGVHHFGGYPYDLSVLAHSMTAQACLSIAWALCALVLMVAGHRGGSRSVWIAGAVLAAVVVLKLFVVELSDRGGLERIVSFIGVGVLLLIVGYFAPLPPRPRTQDAAATH